MARCLSRRLKPALAAATIAAISAGLLPGCGGGDTVTLTQTRLDRAPIDYRDYAQLGYRLDWRGIPAMQAGGSIELVAPAGDVVAVIDSEGTLSIIEDSTGRTRATNGLADSLTNFLGAGRVGENIVVATDNELYVVNAGGATLEDRESFEALVTTPFIRNGSVLIMGAADGQITGHLVGQGVRLYANRVGGPVRTPPVFIPGSNSVAVASQTGEVLFVNRDGLRRTGQSKMFNGPGGPLAAGDGRAYIASLDQSLYAFDPLGGIVRWRHRTEHPLTEGPAFHGGWVFCELEETGLTAFDSGTGEVMWESPRARGRVVAVRGTRLISWDADERTAYVVERSTGDLVSVVRLPTVAGFFTQENANIQDPDLYTITDTGILAKFIPNN